ncbi:11888_t:CDS:2 [Ambispora leptoticha]|uniref:11888_t:CDS:1 n=1 Tax=Ambispora leptoticha TaxID=144679 RepID=A0A9N9G895_9GLOM|nr:11888_t:CDS:2 [Ambispora leptoticha]
MNQNNISKINERQDHPLGPNYDGSQAASQTVWNLYQNLQNLSHSSQLTAKQAQILAAFKFFLGDEIP